MTKEEVLKLDKVISMAQLLLECRDALPAITVASAKLYGVSPTLADRIEDELEPWLIKEEIMGEVNEPRKHRTPEKRESLEDAANRWAGYMYAEEAFEAGVRYANNKPYKPEE